MSGVSEWVQRGLLILAEVCTLRSAILVHYEVIWKQILPHVSFRTLFLSRAASHTLSPCHISPPRSRLQRSPSWQTSRRARWCAASSAWTRCWRRCDKPPASWETPSWGARWRRPPWPSAGTSSSPPPSTPTERRRHACSQVLLCVQGVRCMLAMVYVPTKKTCLHEDFWTGRREWFKKKKRTKHRQL